MNISNLVTAICSLLFFMIGFDKFLHYLEPPCSLMDSISPILWKTLGVLQILGGILIWFKNTRRYIAAFFVLFMLFFTSLHLIENTFDVGGAVFIAILLAILVWNPKFIRGKENI